jgi:hypothetical protein
LRIAATCGGVRLFGRITVMLLPRFSIRTMLLVALGVAVASVFAGQALGGRVWALGLTVGLVSVPIALAVQAGFFAIGSAFAQWLGPQEIVARTSRGGVERTAAPLPESVHSPGSSPTPPPAAS